MYTGANTIDVTDGATAYVYACVPDANGEDDVTSDASLDATPMSATTTAGATGAAGGAGPGHCGAPALALALALSGAAPIVPTGAALTHARPPCASRNIVVPPYALCQWYPLPDASYAVVPSASSKLKYASSDWSASVLAGHTSVAKPERISDAERARE